MIWLALLVYSMWDNPAQPPTPPGTVIALSAEVSATNFEPASAERKIVVGNPKITGRYYMPLSCRRWTDKQGRQREWNDPVAAGVDCVGIARVSPMDPTGYVVVRGVTTSRGTVVIDGFEVSPDGALLR